MFVNIVPASQKVIDQVVHALIENIHIDQLLNFISPVIDIDFIKEQSEACFCYLRGLREPSANADLFNKVVSQPQNSEYKHSSQLFNSALTSSISPEIPIYFTMPRSSRILLRSQSIPMLNSAELSNTEKTFKTTSTYNFHNNELPDVSEIAKQIGNMIEISEETRCRSKSVSDLESMYLKISPSKVADFYLQLENLEKLVVFLNAKIEDEKLINKNQSAPNNVLNKELTTSFLEVWKIALNFLNHSSKDQKHIKVQIINTLLLPLVPAMLFLVGENIEQKIKCSVLQTWFDNHIIDLLSFDYEGNYNSISKNIKSKVIEIQTQVLEAIEEKFKTEAIQNLEKIKTYSDPHYLVSLVDEKQISGIEFWNIVKFEEKIIISKINLTNLHRDEDLKKEYMTIKNNLENGVVLDPFSLIHGWFNNMNVLLKII